MSTLEILIIVVVIVVAVAIILYANQRNRAAAQLKADEEAAIDENIADAAKEKAPRRSKRS